MLRTTHSFLRSLPYSRLVWPLGSAGERGVDRPFVAQDVECRQPKRAATVVSQTCSNCFRLRQLTYSGPQLTRGDHTSIWQTRLGCGGVVLLLIGAGVACARGWNEQKSLCQKKYEGTFAVDGERHLAPSRTKSTAAFCSVDKISFHVSVVRFFSLLVY